MDTTTSKPTAKLRRARTAEMLLNHGFDIMCEFYDELAAGRDWKVGHDIPDYDTMRQLVTSWSCNVIAAAEAPR